jgi:hypothetical protein
VIIEKEISGLTAQGLVALGCLVLPSTIAKSELRSALFRRRDKSRRHDFFALLSRGPPMLLKTSRSTSASVRTESGKDEQRNKQLSNTQ